MGTIYGYARVSTKTQRLDRQISNIINAFPEVKQIYMEKYTGTDADGRIEFQKLRKKVVAGDTIIFDSVSRMSRQAEKGIELYMEFYNRDVELVFLKEPHINTETYKKAISNQIAMTGETVDLILEGINKYLMELAKEQIRIALEQAEKEVKDLQTRVSEGMRATQRKNKELPEGQQVQIGQKKGAKLTTKKSIEAKRIILKNSKDFNGTNTDIEVMKIANISRNSYYKYKRELMEEQGQA
jgi:DNA invertase Pin-like site-specific DNA recombinase